jgi:hypothetical protein
MSLAPTKIGHEPSRQAANAETKNSKKFQEEMRLAKSDETSSPQKSRNEERPPVDQREKNQDVREPDNRSASNEHRKDENKVDRKKDKDKLLEQDDDEKEKSFIEAVKIAKPNDSKVEEVAKHALKLTKEKGLSNSEALDKAMTPEMKNNIDSKGLEKIAELFRSYSNEELKKAYAKSGVQSEVFS